MKKRWTLSLVAAAAAIVTFSPVTEASKQTVTSYPVSSGVTYEQYKYNASYGTNVVNHLTVNLNDPYTKVALGLAGTTNGRMTTTAMASAHSKEGHRVVGAINAGFFDMSVGNPLLLLADNNEIINGGRISVGDDEFVNKPYAFGVKQDGTPSIDLFDFDVSMSYQGKKYELSGLNRKRYDNEAIVFTPQHYLGDTGQNSFGVEVVVDTGKLITENTFGQTLTGKITHVFPYSEKWPANIPDTGFVLSVHGTPWRAMMENMKVGEEVTIDFSINDAWNNADFMIATGPLLVEDGKVNLQMSATSSRAREIAPRTVVGVDEDTKQVHYITVDGRQTVSKGMNMTQLANYLVDIGVDTAINLDGGGSTAMGVRKIGTNDIVLANKPSDGSQRRVSTILEAISTAPTSEAARATVTRSRVGTFLVGASAEVTSVSNVMDKYYNPISAVKSKLSVSSEKGTISGQGLTYTMNEAGIDRLQIAYDGAIFQTYPITTVTGPSELYLRASATTVSPGETIQFSINALDANKEQLLYDKYQLTYKVEGDIGTINQDGKFTASKTGGTGKVIATLGDKSAGVNVTVKAATTPTPPATSTKFKDILSTYPYVKEIEYLADQKYFNGYTDGTFRPDEKLTRAHAAVIISRILNLNTDTIKNPNFSDVPTTYTYYKEIAAVQNLGIVDGSNGKFNPSGQLTRAHMSKILTLAFMLEGSANKSFKDVDPSHWVHEYVQALAANGVTTGYEDGSFKPNVPISRAHFAVFLYRTLEK
ncbi:MAG: S-layer homology domain-containing protein [Caryophanon sp.]|nr:S-layer homology domain-containing protein [Caryophanon sp.]